MKLRYALVAALTLMTAACGRGNPLEVTVSNCPALSVLGDAGTVTRFAGEGRDVGDVTYTATISSAVLNCTEHEDGVDATVDFDVVARSGEALATRSVDLEYFIVVMKDNSQIVTKEIYDVTLDFDSSTDSAVSHQVIATNIPTLEQAKRYDYEILIGFQLTNDEAAYNIAR